VGSFEIENLTYHYPESELPALAEVNLRISEGEFVFLAGPSGCGKSSLLRAMAGLLPDFYGGKIGGTVKHRGMPLTDWDKRELAQEIGIIFQDPEKQIVMTTVEQEIAFGLENINTPLQEMRLRVAEMLALFGLSAIRSESTFNLSGGQKQKVALAAVLAMYPKVLLLDEPTSQLDPLAAQELLNYLQRLNLEWGLTVVLVEQRIDRCFHLADRVVFMDQGRIVKAGTPREVVKWAASKFPRYTPPVSQLFAGWQAEEIPLTIKEGRVMLEAIKQQNAKALVAKKMLPATFPKETPVHRPEVLRVSKLYATYDQKSFVLKNLNLSLPEACISVIFGENGSGKSTLLKTIAGLLKPARGKVFHRDKELNGLRPEQIAMKVGYLSQNPNDYLFNDTVLEEIAFNLKVRGEKDEQRVGELLRMLKLGDKGMFNPRDLSGGERQRVALGSVLITAPEVLLLDEPTRGLDANLKEGLGELLVALTKQGTAVLLVTHDVEFAAEISDRVIIMSDGEIVAAGDKRKILTNSLYYSPQVNRLFKGIDDSVLSIADSLFVLKSFVKKSAI
jgi:energy-coupling factor transporter ATP-binding protein EcfA2